MFTREINIKRINKRKEGVIMVNKKHKECPWCRSEINIPYFKMEIPTKVIKPITIHICGECLNKFTRYEKDKDRIVTNILNGNVYRIYKASSNCNQKKWRIIENKKINYENT